MVMLNVNVKGIISNFENPPMKRRTFIVTSSVAVVAAALPFACSFSDDVAPASLALIWDPATIIDIGNKYRALVPAEDGKEQLSKLLRVTDEARVKNDFAERNHVVIDGWLLSVTEARQCAMFAIMQS